MTIHQIASRTLQIGIILVVFTLLYFISRTEEPDTDVHTCPTLWSQPQPIRALQKSLIDLGYDCGEFAPDGIVGPKTMTAWKHWDMVNAGLIESEWEK